MRDIVIIGAIALWPNPNNPSSYFDWPFTRDGKFLENVYSRSADKSPELVVPQHREKLCLTAIYLGCGTGDCTITTEAECTEGEWLGEDSTCDACVFCYDPFADADNDADVDQEDFAVLQACITGNGGGMIDEPCCKCFDRPEPLVGDNDVDQDDMAKFELCASGPGIPALDSCDD